jgi:hypothetical protein
VSAGRTVVTSNIKWERVKEDDEDAYWSSVS